MGCDQIPMRLSEISVDHKTSNPRFSIHVNQTDSNEKHESRDFGINNRDIYIPPDANEEIILEPLEQNPYDVSYTCLLLPRLGSHLLLDDIAIHLQMWMKQICVSFGWRLEFLSVKPDYLHWTIRVPPATSTAFFMHVVREQTSLHVLTDFPRLKRENHSGDFWAPGYLIIWGSQPHPIEIIQRFIRQTRQQQGIQMDE